MDDGDSSQHIIISTALSLILFQKRMTELYAFFLTSNLIHAYNCNIFHKHHRIYTRRKSSAYRVDSLT